MLGSSNSIACAQIMLNSAGAESLRIYADRLEQAEDFESALHEMIQKTIRDHKRIIFNGNGYDESWIKEAVEKLGLLNLRTTPDAVPHILDKKNVDMLTLHGVFSEAEIRSRYEITLDNYCKTVRIEANTMADMAKTQIAPAVEAYAADVARAAAAKKSLVPDISCAYEIGLVKKLSALTDRISVQAEKLEEALMALHGTEDVAVESAVIRDTVLTGMSELRVACDEAETLQLRVTGRFRYMRICCSGSGRRKGERYAVYKNARSGQRLSVCLRPGAGKYRGIVCKAVRPPLRRRFGRNDLYFSIGESRF